MEPKAITAKAVQDAALAFLRIIGVLAGGLTVLFGLVAKRDLAGLIAWVQSDAFVVFAGALISAGSLVWGLWKTYDRSHKLSTAKTVIEQALPVEPPASHPGDKFTHLTPLIALPLLLATVVLSGCATAGDVRLNAGRAFLTAQLALKSAQQSSLVVCTNPAPRLVVPCREAREVLRRGAQAEAAGFAAQQAGNAADLQNAVTALIAIPPALVALGILGSN